MRRTSLYYLLVVWITVFCLGLDAKDTKRSKRQLTTVYICGRAPNTFVSQNPCQYQNSGCGQPYCNNFQSNTIIPQSFYNPANSCYNSCNNFNCNNYNGQYLNGQYVAYQYGSNQYSPCASNCCRFMPQPIQIQPTLHDPFSTLWGLGNFRHNYHIGSGVSPSQFGNGFGTQVLQPDATAYSGLGQGVIDDPYTRGQIPNPGTSNGPTITAGTTDFGK